MAMNSTAGSKCSIWKRAKRAIIASQNTRRIARLAQIPRCARDDSQSEQAIMGGLSHRDEGKSMLRELRGIGSRGLNGKWILRILPIRARSFSRLEPASG